MYQTKIVFPWTTHRLKPRILRNSIRKRPFRQGKISFPVVSRSSPPISFRLCPYIRPKKVFYQAKISFPCNRYSTERKHSSKLLRAESRRPNNVRVGLPVIAPQFHKSFSAKDMVCMRSHVPHKAIEQ